MTWRDNPERWVQQRSRYVSRRYGLGDRQARALAWHEIGYTSTGVAKKIGATAGTVRGYFEAIAEEHGDAAVLIRCPGELAIDAPLTGEVVKA